MQTLHQHARARRQLHAAAYVYDSAVPAWDEPTLHPKPTLVVAYGSINGDGLGHLREQAIARVLGIRRWSVARYFNTLCLIDDPRLTRYAPPEELIDAWLHSRKVSGRVLVFGRAAADALDMNDCEWFELDDVRTDVQGMRCPAPWSARDMRGVDVQRVRWALRWAMGEVGL